MMLQTEERILVPDSVSYVDFQTSMVRLAKQIAKHAQDMVSGYLLNEQFGHFDFMCCTLRSYASLLLFYFSCMTGQQIKHQSWRIG